MTQKDNILQELNELGSSLANASFQDTYTVPSGYFEGLIGQVLSRIKALDAETASAELAVLSPVLAAASKVMPYRTPAGYFESLPDKMIGLVQNNEQSAAEELEHLSPLLSGLKKDMPYSVPAGYFENLPVKKESKVVSLASRKWFRYAAAAVVVGVIATIGIISLRTDHAPSEKEIFTKITRDVNKMSDSEKDNLIDFLNAGLNGNETAQVNTDKPNDFKELLKDIPEEELNNFSEQNEDLQDFLLTSD